MSANVFVAPGKVELPLTRTVKVYVSSDGSPGVPLSSQTILFAGSGVISQTASEHVAGSSIVTIAVHMPSSTSVYVIVIGPPLIGNGP